MPKQQRFDDAYLSINSAMSTLDLAEIERLMPEYWAAYTDLREEIEPIALAKLDADVSSVLEVIRLQFDDETLFVRELSYAKAFHEQSQALANDSLQAGTLLFDKEQFKQELSLIDNALFEIDSSALPVIEKLTFIRDARKDAVALKNNYYKDMGESELKEIDDQIKVIDDYQTEVEKQYRVEIESYFGYPVNPVELFNPKFPVGEDKPHLGLLDAVPDGNCGLRALVQGLLLDGILRPKHREFVITFLKRIVLSSTNELSAIDEQTENLADLLKPEAINQFLALYETMTAPDLITYFRSLNKDVSPDKDKIIYALAAYLRADIINYCDLNQPMSETARKEMSTAGVDISVGDALGYLNYYDIELQESKLNADGSLKLLSKSSLLYSARKKPYVVSLKLCNTGEHFMNLVDEQEDAVCQFAPVNPPLSTPKVRPVAPPPPPIGWIGDTNSPIRYIQEIHLQQDKIYQFIHQQLREITDASLRFPHEVLKSLNELYDTAVNLPGTNDAFKAELIGLKEEFIGLLLERFDVDPQCLAGFIYSPPAISEERFNIARLMGGYQLDKSAKAMQSAVTNLKEAVSGAKTDAKSKQEVARCFAVVRDAFKSLSKQVKLCQASGDMPVEDFERCKKLIKTDIEALLSDLKDKKTLVTDAQLASYTQHLNSDYKEEWDAPGSQSSRAKNDSKQTAQDKKASPVVKDNTCYSLLLQFMAYRYAHRVFTACIILGAIAGVVALGAVSGIAGWAALAETVASFLHTTPMVLGIAGAATFAVSGGLRTVGHFAQKSVGDKVVVPDEDKDNVIKPK